jgi:hypothetical protein
MYFKNVTFKQKLYHSSVEYLQHCPQWGFLLNVIVT